MVCGWSAGTALVQGFSAALLLRSVSRVGVSNQTVVNTSLLSAPNRKALIDLVITAHHCLHQHLLQTIQPALSIDYTMIRRTPTMIPMSDADVQEIRDLVVDQKSRFEAKQKTLLAMKKVAEHPIQPNDPETLPWFHLLVAERNRRLGIPAPSTGIPGPSTGIPGPSTSGSS